MAYTNAKDLMTAICDAVREKEGSSELIPHQDLPERIRNADRVYLYNFGDECVDITGGWSNDGVSNYWSSVPFTQAEKLEDSMYFPITNAPETICCIFSKSAIDMAKHKAIYVKVKSGDSFANGVVQFTTTRKFTYDNSENANSAVLWYQDAPYDIYKMDVTNLSTNKYLKLYRWNVNMEHTVYAIWSD